MDLCVIDWKVIAPILASLIASGTALYISNKWSRQKGGEVIATESKQVIKDVLDLVKIINYIAYGLKKNEDFNEEFAKFESGYELVVINTAFIEDCILDDNLKVYFSRFAKSSLKVKRMIKNDNKIPGDIELEEAINQFNEEAIQLVNTLNPYSIYRKECKFKSKKV